MDSEELNDDFNFVMMLKEANDKGFEDEEVKDVK